MFVSVVPSLCATLSVAAVMVAPVGIPAPGKPVRLTEPLVDPGFGGV